MLRPASPSDAGFVEGLWTAPENARFIPPPEPDEIDSAVSVGRLMVWQPRQGPLGFAALMMWQPRVWSIWAMATAIPGQGHGRAMLDALLAELFDTRNAHRVGLDTTIDNLPALRLYESAGFVREGVWRQCWQRPDGEWVDCAFLAMLRGEWRR